MSRTSLHMPRHTRAVWLRPATGTRLFPYPFPPNVPPHIPHYKRCPKAHRLRLRSDQSLFPPVQATGYGRSPDKTWLALSKGPCQVRAPLTRRIRFASSGDALEHSVMSPPWAIAPPPDSPGLDLAGESEQSDNLRLKTNAPFRDSTVVTIGELRSTNAGHGSTLPSLRVVGHFWWSRLPHTEIILASPPLSRTSSQKHLPGAVAEPASMWNIRCGGKHPSVQASPSSCATVRDLPSPLPLVHFPSRDDRPVAQGVDAPNGASTPLPRPKKGTAH